MYIHPSFFRLYYLSSVSKSVMCDTIMCVHTASFSHIFCIGNCTKHYALHDLLCSKAICIVVHTVNFIYFNFFMHFPHVLLIENLSEARMQMGLQQVQNAANSTSIKSQIRGRNSRYAIVAYYTVYFFQSNIPRIFHV